MSLDLISYYFNIYVRDKFVPLHMYNKDKKTFKFFENFPIINYSLIGLH